MIKPKINTSRIKNSLSQKGVVSLSKIPFRKWLYLSIGVNLTVTALVYIFSKRLPPQLPLFYGLPEGKSQLVSKLLLPVPSFIAIFITFLNSMLCYFIENDFLKKTLIIFSFAVSFFAIITIVKIFFLVGNI